MALGALHHQVDVQPAARPADLVAQRLYDQRTDRDRRDEVAVHHVDVDDAGTRLHDGGDLIAQACEVGREDRRENAPPAWQLVGHRGWSIEAPQWLQLSIAVLDMRTIVECSPQLGQSDTSSKRRRQ